MQASTDTSVLRRRLDAGLTAMAVDLDEQARDRLVAYLRLLNRWNRTYNLTAVRDPQDMVARHLLDSLAVIPYLRGERCLDVGSGAGLPGLVLAVACPAISWVLLDSNAKKCRFLRGAQPGRGFSPRRMLFHYYKPRALQSCRFRRRGRASARARGLLACHEGAQPGARAAGSE